jgi:hypothetical protein
MGTSAAVIRGKQWNNNVAQPMGVFFDQIEAFKRKPDPITYTFDPLALTLAKLADGSTKGEIVETLSHSVTQGSWIAEFDQQAADIRKYYRNKLLLQTLKHTKANMSKFRQDLQNYVGNETPYIIDRADIPMIVKLPDFYDEDKMMDQFVKDYCMDLQYYQNTIATTQLTLYPMRKFHRKTQRSDSMYYWLRDDANLVYRIELDPKNPCMHLFEREFANSSVKLNTMCNLTRTRGQSYTFYKLNKWEIL